MTSVVQAQTPPDAGQIQRQLEQELRAPDAPQSPQAAPAPTPVDTAGPQVVIRRVDIQGATLVPADELAHQFDAYLGQPLSLGQLQAAAQTLAGYYRERGWFARVQLPEQDVSDGTLRIRIIEGRFGRVELQPGSSRANADYIAGVVGHRLEADKPYSLADLERGLLLANDLPGIRADGVLKAGQKPGSSDLALTVSDRPWVSGQALLNNQGSRATGRAQATAQLALNDPSGFGDQLRVTGVRSQHLEYGQLNYSSPLGHDGLRADISYSQLSYRLGKQFASLDAQGHSNTLQAGLSYPLLRSTQRNLWLSAEQARTRQEDETLGITLRRRQIDTSTLALRGDARDDWHGGGQSSGRLALSSGRADLRLDADERQDAAGASIDGHFTLVRLDLRRDQLLSPSLYLSGRLSSQLAFNNLDSSQRFSLGGPYGVRGYPINEGSGDSGALAQLELHSRLPWSGIAGLDGYLFIDGGVVRQNHDTWQGWDTADSGRNTYSLYATGLGLAWSHPRGFAINGVLATPLGNNPGSGIDDRDQDGTRSGPRAWITLSQEF